MAGHFELKASAGDKFMFNLKAANHQIVLTSETYSEKAAALAGIDSVKKNAPDDSRYQRKVAKDAQRVTSGNLGQHEAENYDVIDAQGQTVGTVEYTASTSLKPPHRTTCWLVQKDTAGTAIVDRRW